MCLAMALFQSLEASSTLSLAEISREQQLSPISSFALLRLVGTLGMFTGRIVAINLSADLAADMSETFKYLVCFLVMALIAWRTVTEWQDRRGDARLTRAASPVEDPSTMQPEGDAEDPVALAAERYGLSKRETEVFEMLARGVAL